MNNRRIMVVMLAALAGVAIAAGAFFAQRPASPASSGRLDPVTEDAFGAPFTLTDENGRRVSSQDFKDYYKLIYFGFTYCPAICPTELATLAAARQALGDQGRNVTALFITVDPERDTPDKLKGYVTLFHPAPVALTGSPADIAKVLKDYKIYAAKVQTPEMTDYTMDHSALVYLIAPDGRLLHIFQAQDTAAQIADVTRQWVLQEER